MEGPESLNELPFLTGGGEMGALIRAKDWTNTSLGLPAQWPASLKQTVSMMLCNTFPTLICWGNSYIQLYNDAFRPIIGLTKHPSALGASAAAFYAEIWDTIGPIFDNVMQGNAVGFPDFKVQMERNGEVEDCYFDFSYSPIKDENGKTNGVLAIGMETTAQVLAKKAIADNAEEFQAINEELSAAIEEYLALNKKLTATNEELLLMQQELQHSEQLFKSIALNIPKSLIVVIDKNHRFITMEGALKAQLGYHQTSYKGLHPIDISSEERYEATKHYYERVLAGEAYAEELILANGGSYTVHFVPLKNNVGQVTSGLIIALDITEHKEEEEKIAKLAAIIENSNDAIISKTLASEITSWNDSAQRIFGYTAAEMIGETIYKLIPEDRKEEEPDILNRLKNGERVEHFETKRLAKNGNLIDVSLTISPIKDKKGNIIGLSKVARDITEKKLIEQRKNDFVAMVSHELKTPLTTINSFVQILLAKAKKGNDEFQVHALTRAEVQAKKMTGMIHDFLNLARLDDGKILLSKTVFDLNPLLLEAIADAQIFSPNHQIEVLLGPPVQIRADRDKIGQVLNNLLSNAIKYSPLGGAIVVRTQIENGAVKVAVQDHGAGISEEDQARLFQRFFRSNNEKLKMVSGFGIGLYLVSEVLRFHHSKIELLSQLDQGSTFSFRLAIEC